MQPIRLDDYFPPLEPKAITVRGKEVTLRAIMGSELQRLEEQIPLDRAEWLRMPPEQREKERNSPHGVQTFHRRLAARRLCCVGLALHILDANGEPYTAERKLDWLMAWADHINTHFTSLELEDIYSTVSAMGRDAVADQALIGDETAAGN